MARAAVAMGSNLGDRAQFIGSGVVALDRCPGVRVAACSAVRETDPVGPAGQGPYLNAAVVVSTSLEPGALLSLLLEIESACGRDRSAGERWGPRTLDLDLLLYDDREIAEPGLAVPHPRMAGRVFVLGPLAEVAPGWEVPGTGRTVAGLLSQLGPGGVAPRVSG